MKKSVIRKNMRIKAGGRMQISSHGAGLYSIQIIRSGKVREDLDLPEQVVVAARR